MKLNELTRTELQNKKMWPMLRDVARQKQWRVNGALVYLDPDEWKDLFTAGLKRQTRIAEGIEGGYVFLGMRTSRMTKDQMIELIEYMYAVGTDWEIRWSEDEC